MPNSPDRGARPDAPRRPRAPAADRPGRTTAKRLRAATTRRQRAIAMGRLRAAAARREGHDVQAPPRVPGLAPWPHPDTRRLARSVVVHAAMVLVIAVATVVELTERAEASRATLGVAPMVEAPGPEPVATRLPHGKGMWIWQERKTEGGDVHAIVARAKATGLTHVWVRTGSSWDGFYGGPFLDRLLPVAHAAGLRVYAWDFPRLIDTGADVARAAAAIHHEAPGGHRVDGFGADIETRSEGVNIGPGPAAAYGSGLRAAVGPEVPLVAVVPTPVWALNHYPYTEVVASFDAVAPMTYWMASDPAAHVRFAIEALAPHGKPVFPIGQAYDGGPEGGPAGVPPPEDIWAFMAAAAAGGAPGVSFWSWQAANGPAWHAIRDAQQYRP